MMEGGLVMRFAIVNPDAERREGLKTLLRQIERRARFSESTDWRGAERAMQRFPTTLLVVDWHEGIGPGELRALTARHPDVPVAVLVDHCATPAAVREILVEGAQGVIRRTTESPLIVKLFEVVLLGGYYVPADLLCQIEPSVPPPRYFNALHARPACKPILMGALSPRQQQIMRCVHMGSTNKMIARMLGISEGTVKIHLASIFQQLGAPNRAAAVAIYNGWMAEQLQVLCTQEDPPPKPTHGERGALPLRRRRDKLFRYPLLTDDNLTVPPLAAEPAAPFGQPAPAAGQGDDEAPADDPRHATCEHVLPPNE